MKVSVEGKVALVTGGSRGIGLATALELANSGAAGVAITSRKTENIEKAKLELIAAGVQEDLILALTARADDEQAAEQAVAATVERFGSEKRHECDARRGSEKDDQLRPQHARSHPPGHGPGQRGLPEARWARGSAMGWTRAFLCRGCGGDEADIG